MKRIIITLLFLTASIPAFAQSGAIWQLAGAASHYFSGASTNSTLVQAGARVLASINAYNSTTTVYYLKLYDKATAPTCGTDTPVLTLPVPNQPSGTTVGQTMAAPYAGIAFTNGIGFCITGASADNDATSAATGVTVDLVVK